MQITVLGNVSKDSHAVNKVNNALTYVAIFQKFGS